jgi:hypothetical protein
MFIKIKDCHSNRLIGNVHWLKYRAADFILVKDIRHYLYSGHWRLE